MSFVTAAKTASAVAAPETMMGQKPYLLQSSTKRSNGVSQVWSPSQLRFLIRTYGCLLKKFVMESTYISVKTW
ncbi:hypothetical protein TNCT_58471 [Trichonephila clavata]|uniref:Uncharacterized protein n=1 Tax=Trichonephila clavata TaxID=2740835 RepID=A0A8X6LUZ0_TRICU|nr:hypothetical protein TNCT_58471 [Trichonephila clavata]